MKSYKAGNGSGKNWTKIALFSGLAIVLLVVVAAIGLKTIYERNLKAVNSNSTSEIIFVVETGDSVSEIANNLKAKELIRSEYAFNQYVRSNQLGEEFIAGTYSLSQSLNVETIVSYLVEGKVNKALCTILPGQRIDQVKQYFIDKCGFTELEVSAGFRVNQYEDHPALVDKPKGASLEGYLYPDSYERINETEVSTIIRLSLDEMAEALTPEVRKGIAAQGLGVYQGIVLSSIVEKEVSGANPKDRPQVAQVFLKRLNEDIALESDATAIYGAVLDGVAKDMNTAQILTYDSKYNTYLHKGLTPTPISNTSKESLLAVANPASTNYLFFVAGCDKVTRFSETFEQHEAYIERNGVNGANCE